MSGVMAPNPRGALTRRTIAGKSVVSFRSHHYALLPWQEWRQALGQAPRLLSIDYHTDKHEAFLRYCHTEWNRRGGIGVAPQADLQALRAERLLQVSPTDPASVDAAVLELRHDEHIKTALQSDILDVAFVIAKELQDVLRSDQQVAVNREWETQDITSQLTRIAEKPSPQPPFTYTLPANRLIILEDTTRIPDEAAYRQWRDQVVDGAFLQNRLALVDDICQTGGIGGLFSHSFILDIDLDAFNTRQAMVPRDTSVFYDLIRRAYAITVAQEPGCVTECQIDGEKLSAAWLEEQLLAHIERALT